MRVLSTCWACSAGAFSNLIVMFGCSLWNAAAIFFICGSLPTQEKNVTVCGVVGSFTGPGPLPMLVSGFFPSLPHAATLSDVARANATIAAVLQGLWNLTTSAPYYSLSGSYGALNGC